MPDDELGQDHRDDVVLVAASSSSMNVITGRASSIRRVDELELLDDTELLPLVFEALLLSSSETTETMSWLGLSDRAYASASSTPQCTLETSTTTVWFIRRLVVGPCHDPWATVV